MILLLLFGSLAQLESLYTAGRYAAVDEQSPPVLAEVSTRADSVRVLELHASALVATGRTEPAVAVFRRMLAMEPDKRLAPTAVSPKIRAVFERALLADRMRSVPDTVYVRQPVPLSVLIPGMHQLQRGRPAPGYVMAGAVAAALVGATVSHFAYNRAYQEYLNSTSLPDLESRYRTADNWYQARNAAAIAGALVWTYSLIDGLMHP